jgi:hypothetical protein
LRSSIAQGLAGVAVLIAVVIVMVAAQQIILAAAPQGAAATPHSATAGDAYAGGENPASLPRQPFNAAASLSA